MPSELEAAAATTKLVPATMSDSDPHKPRRKTRRTVVFADGDLLEFLQWH
jgi:hypothetical protein